MRQTIMASILAYHRACHRLSTAGAARRFQHTLNCENALKKSEEGQSFTDLAEKDAAILQGIGPKSLDALNTLGIQSIKDLANYKYYHISKSIVQLSQKESDFRPETSQMNINKAVDKAYETKSFREMAEAPVAALQGITEAKGETAFLDLGVKTIQDLANLKYCHWAESIVTLAKYEEK